MLFFGTFVPLQGTPTVAAAMGLVGDAPIDFTIVGRGQDRAAFDAQARRARGREWSTGSRTTSSPGLIADHDVVLGVFGTTDKAARVIPNKVYQAAAVGRAIVTADTPAARDAFGDDAVLTPAGDAPALAAALVALAGDRKRVGRLSARPRAGSTAASRRP